MTVAELHAAMFQHALSLPEAWEDHPWDDTVLKVRKKIFLFISPPGDEGFGFSVKLPNTALEALAEDFTKPTGYGLGKAGWVSARVRTGEELSLAEALAWVEESYRAVAPKRVVKAWEVGRG
ncbi:MAG: MmcQ/YjbR family DNA-binding protein [Alphaproteobacteria bacterium]|nr:MmcQ/YjbR family DNA-binding protein [Alphaproteobacteria bacterium]MCB9794035.1 MmcQ/YjbR family DNA-binding protein [Alphaproteobacteria bacterium]